MSPTSMRRSIKLLAITCIVLGLLLWRAELAARERGQRQAAQARLDTPLHEVIFDKTPLSDAIARLSKDSGVDIVIRRDALLSVGVWDDTPISLSLHETTLRRALRMVLDDVTPVSPQLDYADVDGVVVVATQQALVFGRVVVRTYDVRILLDNMTTTRFEVLKKAATQPSDLEGAMNQAEGSAEGALGELVKGVAPTTWGTFAPGDIVFLGTRAVVMNAPEVQAGVRDRLDELTRQAALLNGEVKP